MPGAVGSVLLCALMTAGCVSRKAEDMVFLTRGDCVNTTAMRANLDAALLALGRDAHYSVIDADSLPPNDRRIGYGTPTVLVGGADLFELPEPAVPPPPAT